MAGLLAATACLNLYAAQALTQVVAIEIITLQNFDAAKQMDVKVEML